MHEAGFRHLVFFRRQGTKPPLVLVPGQSGYAFTFRNMADALDCDQPVLALQMLGVDPEEALVEYSVGQMAAVFVPQILAACPRGPILLGGYSMGAMLAFEVAYRLHVMGRAIPLLVSFDGFAPQAQYQSIAIRDRLRAHSAAMRVNLRAYMGERQRDLHRRMLKRAGREWELAPGLASADPQTNERVKKLAVLRERAASRYRPRFVVPTSMLLIRAEEPEVRLGTRVDQHYGWKRYVSGSVSTMTVRGNHRSLLDSCENQRAMAQSISSHLHDTYSTSHGNRTF